MAPTTISSDWGDTSLNVTQDSNAAFMTVDGPLKHFFAAAHFVAAIFVLFGNILTIIAIIRTPQLRIQANLYILQLAVADSLVGVCGGMGAFLYMEFSRENFDSNKYLCLGMFTVHCTSAGASLKTLSLMAIDRLVQVAFPFRYTRYFTETRIKRMLLCTWLSAFALGSVPLYANNFSSKVGCLPFRVLRGTFDQYVLPSMIGATLIITKACYTAIACIARKHRKTVQGQEARIKPKRLSEPKSHDHFGTNVPKRSSDSGFKTVPKRASNSDNENFHKGTHPTTTNPDFDAENFLEGTQSTRTDQDETKLRRHWSGSASANQKSLMLFVTVNTLYTFCWGPFVITSFVSSQTEIPELVASLVVLLLVINSGMNCAVYACRNKQFARAYKKLLSDCCQC